MRAAALNLGRNGARGKAASKTGIAKGAVTLRPWLSTSVTFLDSDGTLDEQGSVDEGQPPLTMIGFLSDVMVTVGAKNSTPDVKIAKKNDNFTNIKLGIVSQPAAGFEWSFVRRWGTWISLAARVGAVGAGVVRN